MHRVSNVLFVHAVSLYGDGMFKVYRDMLYDVQYINVCHVPITSMPEEFDEDKALRELGPHVLPAATSHEQVATKHWIARETIRAKTFKK